MFNQFTAFKFLRRVGSRPWFWLGGPLLLYVWAVPGPFVFDDLTLLRKTERYIDGERERLDLFRFAPTEDDWRAMRSRGTYPWWAPADKRIDFQRPIAEWSFWLDVKVLGRNPIGPRIESLFFFAMGLLLVHRLFRSAEPDTLRAGLATFFLGISQCLAQPVAFLSNRSDLFVLIGVAIAGDAYFRLRTRPSWVTGTIGVLGFVFALLSKEPAIALAGVIAAHALIARRPRFGAGVSTAQARYAIAIVVAAAIYLAWYLQVSEGGAGPFNAERIIAMGRNFLTYSTVWAIGLPIAILPHAFANATLIAAALGVACWMAIGWVALRQWRNRRPGLLFFVLWMLAFIAPALLTIPESRALSIATIGWAWLLAGLLFPREDAQAAARPPSIWTRQWFLAANGIVSVCCSIGTLYMMTQFEQQARSRLDSVVKALEPPLADDETLVLLKAHSPYELICAGDRLAVVSGQRNVRAVYLTLEDADAKVSHAAARDYLIRGKAPQLFDTPAHQLTLGASYDSQIGDTFELDGITFEIAELNDAGEVTAIQMTLHDDIDRSRIRTWPQDLLDK